MLGETNPNVWPLDEILFFLCNSLLKILLNIETENKIKDE